MLAHILSQNTKYSVFNSNFVPSLLIKKCFSFFAYNKRNFKNIKTTKIISAVVIETKCIRCNRVYKVYIFIPRLCFLCAFFCGETFSYFYVFSAVVVIYLNGISCTLSGLTFSICVFFLRLFFL